jgi:hypothetical protein
MNETHEDIRSTADAIVRDAETLTAIEREKMALDPDDPRVVELSVRAEALASRLLEETRIERALAAARAMAVDEQRTKEATSIECAACGAVEWRRSGTIIVGDAIQGDAAASAEVFAGVTSNIDKWTCTCGQALSADDPRGQRLDAMARRREPWIRRRR